jgi:hypothetical protein
MAYGDFTLTRDRPPCGGCSHSAGGCKVRSSCLKWADWERRKAQRYDTVRQARSIQVEEFGIARDTFRRALARRAIGR